VLAGWVCCREAGTEDRRQWRMLIKVRSKRYSNLVCNDDVDDAALRQNEGDEP